MKQREVIEETLARIDREIQRVPSMHNSGWLDMYTDEYRFIRRSGLITLKGILENSSTRGAAYRALEADLATRDIHSKYARVTSDDYSWIRSELCGSEGADAILAADLVSATSCSDCGCHQQ